MAAQVFNPFCPSCPLSPVCPAASVGIRYFAPVLDPAQLRQDWAPMAATATPSAPAGTAAGPTGAVSPAPAPASPAADRRMARSGGKQSLLTRLSPRASDRHA